MDNALTPNKIQKLMKYAQERSFNTNATSSRRHIDIEDEVKKTESQTFTIKPSTPHQESSGILDLSQIEGIASLSLSKSTGFNPGEMTGRSTGATDYKSRNMQLDSSQNPETMGRKSLAIDNILSQMDKQTSEINDIMRHSIASNFSFHSKRDLTADEESLVFREAPLPVQHSTQLQDSMSVTNISSLSMGAYFKHRCPDFGGILNKIDSPERRAMQPSITEVSSTTDHTASAFQLDNTLDCVPVKESANSEIEYHVNTTYNKDSENTYNSQTEKHNSVSTTKTLENLKPTSLKTDLSSARNSMNAKKNNFNLLTPGFQQVTEDTEESENSYSTSKIRNYLLDSPSDISLSKILYRSNVRKNTNKKQPLAELYMNLQDKFNNQEVKVTHLKDTKNTETASSAGTIETVISMNKTDRVIPDKDLTGVVINATRDSNSDEGKLSKTRSQSPSSKSQSTLSTVHENYASFKSGCSPNHQIGEANTTKYVPSPNVVYKELDKSVDWHDVIRHKRSEEEGLAKGSWAEITAGPAKGFVGVPCRVSLQVTTLTDSWLTAKFQFEDLPNDGQDLSIELPRQPLILSPGKSETFTLMITSNIELDTIFHYTMALKDASLDCDIVQKGSFKIQLKIPTVKAMSSDGINKVQFSPVLEKTTKTRSLILISDCPSDLQLVLSITEGDTIFSIKSVQEIKKEDINEVLWLTHEEAPKLRNKSTQVCRLSRGNAIKVTIAFAAPRLADLNLEESSAVMKGCLKVMMIGVDTILEKVDLFGVVGAAILVPRVEGPLRVGSEPTTFAVKNMGTMSGSWVVKCKPNINENNSFNISPLAFDITPDGTVGVLVSYTGQQSNEMTLVFEELTSGQQSSMEIIGVANKPKSFPIKCNYQSLSWVRPGRKEISLKCSSDKKFHVRCQIIGEGFSLDLPGMESRGIYAFSFMPNECRSLPIIFQPTTSTPQTATLHLVYDKSTNLSRKIKLFGCAGGEAIRWDGLMTYGKTALLRAINRMPIELKLTNKSTLPAFVFATVNFDLQYMSIQESARVIGCRNIIPARGRHTITLAVDWNKVERRAREAASAATLATVTAFTGSNVTRCRILKILRNKSTGELDLSALPEHLKVLAEAFEGEDSLRDKYLENFDEPMTSLDELIGGLQQLRAQIDLQNDFDQENTIIINDDTVIEHHTLMS